MTGLFLRLREQTTVQKGIGLFVYGLITFIAIYILGNVFFNDLVIFRIFEFLWFVHIAIICNQIQQSQRELFIIALIALSPGIVNNMIELIVP
ncbi:MAG: hypothetical protein GFH27_549327n41 [Chloroflexi bacterium AL-W]|nr:hypothetical protein [Chloroflexi bacterium AL-N1]NOK69653.1 hypothetical protein [Chloroflexi bacterium AL-N10]NOK72200.1 hypothetical protein [Chloroflexi bacterium AL-N5]NOK85029.1 hypothetical protein [Chloroflexi bacterium AL-W]NOK91782.1 hypothetical protein [Chloroflexi bacterium AL-N15]